MALSLLSFKHQVDQHGASFNKVAEGGWGEAENIIIAIIISKDWLDLFPIRMSHFYGSAKNLLLYHRKKGFFFGYFVLQKHVCKILKLLVFYHITGIHERDDKNVTFTR